MLLPFNNFWKSEPEFWNPRFNSRPLLPFNQSGFDRIRGVVKHWVALPGVVKNNGSHPVFQHWVTSRLRRHDKFEYDVLVKKNVSVVPIHNFPPGTRSWWIGTRESPRYKHFFFEIDPTVGVPSFSVLPISSCRFPKDMHIFREPESWNVSTGTSQKPGPEHAWYKWWNGSRNSETWFLEDKILISGMIKWKRPKLGVQTLIEFSLKTDSGFPKDTRVNKPWQPLGILFAITPINQLHQSPPSPIPGDLGRCPSHQSHVLERTDTYGQAQICSKGHQVSSVDHPCQPSLHWIKFWHVRNPLPQSIRLRHDGLSVLVCHWAGQGEWSLF